MLGLHGLRRLHGLYLGNKLLACSILLSGRWCTRHRKVISFQCFPAIPRPLLVHVFNGDWVLDNSCVENFSNYCGIKIPNDLNGLAGWP